jgi:hypothetical protein
MSTLHKPVLQPELPLDGSVLQQPICCLCTSALKQPVLPGRVFSIEPMLPLDVSEHSKAACTASERVYPTAASARFCSSVLQHTVLHLNVFVLAAVLPLEMCLLKNSLCCTWTCLVYSSLCCPWTSVLQQPVLPLDLPLLLQSMLYLGTVQVQSSNKKVPK